MTVGYGWQAGAGHGRQASSGHGWQASVGGERQVELAKSVTEVEFNGGIDRRRHLGRGQIRSAEAERRASDLPLRSVRDATCGRDGQIPDPYGRREFGAIKLQHPRCGKVTERSRRDR